MWWGWKLLIFYGLSLLLSVIFSVALAILGKKKNSGEAKAKVVVTGREGAPAVLAVSLLMVAYLDRRPLASLGLHFYSSWWQELALGTAIGLVMLLLTAALLRIFIGENPLQFPSHTDFRVIFTQARGQARGALVEELFVRGYPLQTLVSGIGAWPAVGVTSAFFGLFHYQRLGWRGVITTALAGLLLAIAVLKTKALWLAVAIHFGFNFLEVALGLRQVEETERLYQLASVIVIAVFLLLLLWMPIQPHPEMENLWNEHILPKRP